MAIFGRAKAKLSAFLIPFHYAQIKKDKNGNILSPKKAIISKSRIEFVDASNNEIAIQEASFICDSHIKISGCGNHITIGRGCQIVQNCFIEIIGNNSSIVFDDDCLLCGTNISLYRENNHFILGRGSYISFGTDIGVSEGTTLTIGKELMCSSNVRIRTSDVHQVFCQGKRTNPGKDICIGDHVWLCPNSVVHKGAIIGAGSILATGSMISKPIKETNVLLVGQPAIIKKRNIEWQR